MSHVKRATSLITSQIDTAPKPSPLSFRTLLGLITSQIDTAPKLSGWAESNQISLITSQIDTAPKRPADQEARADV